MGAQTATARRRQTRVGPIVAVSLAWLAAFHAQLVPLPETWVPGETEPVPSSALEVRNVDLEIEVRGVAGSGQTGRPEAQVTARYRLTNRTGQRVALDVAWPVFVGLPYHDGERYEPDQLRFTAEHDGRPLPATVDWLVTATPARFGAARERGRRYARRIADPLRAAAPDLVDALTAHREASRAAAQRREAAGRATYADTTGLCRHLCDALLDRSRANDVARRMAEGGATADNVELLLLLLPELAPEYRVDVPSGGHPYVACLPPNDPATRARLAARLRGRFEAWLASHPAVAESAARAAALCREADATPAPAPLGPEVWEQLRQRTGLARGAAGRAVDCLGGDGPPRADLEEWCPESRSDLAAADAEQERFLRAWGVPRTVLGPLSGRRLAATSRPGPRGTPWGSPDVRLPLAHWLAWEQDATATCRPGLLTPDHEGVAAGVYPAFFVVRTDDPGWYRLMEYAPRHAVARLRLLLDPGREGELTLRCRVPAEPVGLLANGTPFHWQLDLPFGLARLWATHGPVGVRITVPRAYQAVVEPAPLSIDWGEGDDPLRVTCRLDPPGTDLTLALVAAATSTLGGLRGADRDTVLHAFASLPATANATTAAVRTCVTALAWVRAQASPNGGDEVFGRYEAWQACLHAQAAFPRAPLLDILGGWREYAACRDVAEAVERIARSPRLVPGSLLDAHGRVLRDRPHAEPGWLLREDPDVLSDDMEREVNQWQDGVFMVTVPCQEDLLTLSPPDRSVLVGEIERRWPQYRDPLERMCGALYLYAAGIAPSRQLQQLAEAAATDPVHAAVGLRLLVALGGSAEQLRDLARLAGAATADTLPAADTQLGRWLRAVRTGTDPDALIEAGQQLACHGRPEARQRYGRMEQLAVELTDAPALARAAAHLAGTGEPEALTALCRGLELACQTGADFEVPRVGWLGAVQPDPRQRTALLSLAERYPERAGLVADVLATGPGDRKAVRQLGLRVYRESRAPSQVRHAARTLARWIDRTVFETLAARTDLPFTCSEPLLDLLPSRGPLTDGQIRFLEAVLGMADIPDATWGRICTEFAAPALVEPLRECARRRPLTADWVCRAIGEQLAKRADLGIPDAPEPAGGGGTATGVAPPR